MLSQLRELESGCQRCGFARIMFSALLASSGVEATAADEGIVPALPDGIDNDERHVSNAEIQQPEAGPERSSLSSFLLSAAADVLRSMKGDGKRHAANLMQFGLDHTKAEITLVDPLLTADPPGLASPRGGILTAFLSQGLACMKVREQ